MSILPRIPETACNDVFEKKNRVSDIRKEACRREHWIEDKEKERTKTVFRLGVDIKLEEL